MVLQILAAAAVAGGMLLGSATVSAQATGQWTTGAPMPSERSEVAVAAVEGKIYVVGGFGGQRELEIYDPETDRWERGAAFPHAVHHPGAAGSGDRSLGTGLYLIVDHSELEVFLCLADNRLKAAHCSAAAHGSAN
jgi:hypothetical protein